MWSRGEDISIAPIKFENHKSTEALDKVIYRLNDLLYFWSKKYISPTAKDRIMTKLTEIGKDLNTISPTPRSEECLKKMRNIYTKVKGYYPEGYVENFEVIQKMLNFSVGMYLKKKDKLTLEERLKIAVENKVLWCCTAQPLFNSKGTTPHTLNCKPFLGMQKELLEGINKLSIIC